MAPTITSPVSKGYMVKGLVNDSTAKSQEATPVGKPALPTAKNDTEVISIWHVHVPSIPYAKLVS